MKIGYAYSYMSCGLQGTTLGDNPIVEGQSVERGMRDKKSASTPKGTGT